MGSSEGVVCSLDGFGLDGEAFCYKFGRVPIKGETLVINDPRTHTQKLYRVVKVTWRVDRWIPGLLADAGLRLELLEEKPH